MGWSLAAVLSLFALALSVYLAFCVHSITGIRLDVCIICFYPWQVYMYGCIGEWMAFSED